MGKLLLLLLLLAGCAQEVPQDEIIPPVEEPVEEVEYTVSFAGVGDNLIHGAVYQDPTYQASFNDMYEHTNSVTQAVDFAFLNQETILGGKSLGLSHYPMFNSPWEIGDAVVNAGFDWVNHATNHTLDRGVAAIEQTFAFWKQYPEVALTGIYESESARNTPVVVEKNNIRFGLLSYTYGLNGFSLPSEQSYMISLIDKDAIAKDIAALKEESDFILVSMHWGNEYQYTPNEEQKELANYLNSLGVDLIIGHHPHVIQPIEVIGDTHKTVVAYSLGNFLSAQDTQERMLGGMLTLEFYKNETTGETAIRDIAFLPTFTHYEFSNGWYRNFKTYFLKDYPQELASKHAVQTSFQNPVNLESVWGLVSSIIDETYLK